VKQQSKMAEMAALVIISVSAGIDM